MTMISLNPDPYKEATGEESTSASAFGYNFKAGIDIPIYKRITIQLAAKFSSAPFEDAGNNLNAGGTSINIGIKY